MAPEDLRPIPITTQHGNISGACRLIERYEQLAKISHAMLDAARCGLWEHVGTLEVQCANLIEELKAALKVEALAPSEQWQRIALLRTILAHDAEIRERSEPWLVQLEKLVPSGHSEGGPVSGGCAVDGASDAG